VNLSIVGAAYKGRSIAVDGQELVNLYLEASPSTEAKNNVVLIGTPGLKLLATIGTTSNGTRGIYVTARNRCLIVVGNILYELDSAFGYTNRGQLNTFSGRVCFAEIDKQVDPSAAPESDVMLVDGNYGYILNTLTNVFTTITGDYFPGTSVISQNGFFIQNMNDSNKFIYSDQYNGLNWQASLNFFAAEASPDPINYLTLINNQLWLVGSKSIEIWNYTGVADQLWERSGVGYIQTGMAGLNCATTIVGNILWLGSDKDGQNIVWQSGSSYTPQRVSTHAIEYIISQLGSVSDCVALSYMKEGHQFVIFNFPSGQRTLVYDLNTQLWHERGDYNKYTGLNEHHRAMFVAGWDNRILVGDVENNNLYELDLDYYTDDTKTIKRVWTCPHIHNERHRVFFHQIEIDLEKGVGLSDGSDPKMMLRYSNDGGYNYSSNEIWQTVGKIGERLVRCRFNKLGMSRDRVFQLIMTDPVKWVLISARMDASTEKV
jgi:hypothetical protein